MKISNLQLGQSMEAVTQSSAEKQKTDLFQQKLETAIEQQDDKALKDACKQFETYFIGQLFKEMKNTIQPGDLIPQSQGEQVFRDMLDEEYSKQAADAGGIGIGDMLYKQLSKNQGNKNIISNNTQPKIDIKS